MWDGFLEYSIFVLAILAVFLIVGGIFNFLYKHCKAVRDWVERMSKVDY